MNLLFLLARVLFGGFFLLNGIGHLKNLAGMAGYAASKKVPAPKIAVAGTGLLLILGGLGIILGVYVQLAVLFLVIFLVPTTFMMHSFWNETDPNMKMMQEIQFKKNIALLGAVIAFFFIPLPWPFVLF